MSRGDEHPSPLQRQVAVRTRPRQPDRRRSLRRRRSRWRGRRGHCAPTRTGGPAGRAAGVAGRGGRRGRTNASSAPSACWPASHACNWGCLAGIRRRPWPLRRCGRTCAACRGQAIHGWPKSWPPWRCGSRWSLRATIRHEDRRRLKHCHESTVNPLWRPPIGRYTPRGSRGREGRAPNRQTARNSPQERR